MLVPVSLCLGCLVALGSFASVGGLGRVTEFVAERRRQRAMQAVLDEPGDERSGEGLLVCDASSRGDEDGPAAHPTLEGAGA